LLQTLATKVEFLIMEKYWMAVACREHVLRGVSGGFAQVCHGKVAALAKMRPNDGIVYYSPGEQMNKKIPCRQFTAIGKVTLEEPYQVSMSESFVPWRRNIKFFGAVTPTPIEPLLEQLSFVTNKKCWGYLFRRGCFEISKADYFIIAQYMTSAHTTDVEALVVQCSTNEVSRDTPIASSVANHFLQDKQKASQF
jgi:hypothetical protein